MAKIIRQADSNVRELVEHVLAEEYPAVAGLDPPIRIGVLFVSDDADKPAITHGGYPVAVQIKVVAEDDRAGGAPDVLLSIDAVHWYGRSEAGNVALIHHELHHLIPVKMVARQGGGHTCQLDSLGRPKVKLRKHDFEIGGFNAIVERYGDDALEWQQVKRVHGAFHQMTLPFVAGDTLAPKRKTAAR